MAEPLRERLSAAESRAARARAPAMSIAPPSHHRPTACRGSETTRPKVCASCDPTFDVHKGTTAPVRKSPAPSLAGPLTRKRFEFTVPFEVTSVIRNIERLSVIDHKGRAWDDLT
ncbi:hypothetical protein GCM10023097_49660 [Streptomyces collinus]